MSNRPILNPDNIQDFLKAIAPFSIIDKGKNFLSNKKISELKKTGTTISASVFDDNLDQKEFQSTIEIGDKAHIQAVCTCCSVEEMNEQWCPHAIGSLLSASENNLLNELGQSNSGVISGGILDLSDSSYQNNLIDDIDSYKINRGKGLTLDFANLISEIKSEEEVSSKSRDIFLSSENIKFEIDLSNKYLGLRISETYFLNKNKSEKQNRILDFDFFNAIFYDNISEINQISTSNNQNNFSKDIQNTSYNTNDYNKRSRLARKSFVPFSDRSIDNILLNIVYEHGEWDKILNIWKFESSQDIEIILGILQEYSNVYINNSLETVKYSAAILDCILIFKWTDTGLSVTTEYTADNSKVSDYVSTIVGNNTNWTLISSTIYKLSPFSSKVATFFLNRDVLVFSRNQLVPILEEFSGPNKHIKVLNPEKEPKKEITSPTPELSFEIEHQQFEHFASAVQVSLFSELAFTYPNPKPNENIVYIPNREEEKQVIAKLKELGFKYAFDKQRFITSGENALDIIHTGTKIFPENWKVANLENCKKELRFSNLNINLTLDSLKTSSDYSAERENNKDEDSDKISFSDFFECTVSLTQNNSNVPLSSLYKHIKTETERWIRLDNGSFAKVPGGGFTQLKTILGIIDPNFKMSNAVKVKLTSMNALALIDIKDPQFKVIVDKGLLKLKQQLSEFQKINKIEISKQFKGELRDYQKDGVSWLDFLYQFELGGILADEMGLGKTVQTLAFLQHLKDFKTKEKNLDKPALIIAPTSVITNWWYEAKKFTPELKAIILHGPQRKKEFKNIPDNDIVITSYALLRLDRQELSNYEFSYLILDEAQNIKNPQTATAKSAKNIRAKRRVALSGTPTENRPMELWSIIDFLMPGFLGTYDFFRNYIEKPIMEGTSSANVSELLRSKTRPFILRRTKNEVEKDLPPKVESVLHVEMTHSQKELYRQILEEVRPKIFEAVDTKGIGGASVSILAALLRLRQVCNHPNSIGALRQIEGFDSGKFMLLKDLVLEALESGRKILIFSQFREMLSIMREWLDSIQNKYLYLDGSTKDRQDLIDQFNQDESIRLFLISLKAGGTGLNLTAADTVIIYDPWWNPAVEGQAVDRAHRIGQKKTVYVYRLVTENSIEQKIMDLKERKSSIVDALINENGLSTLSLSKNDLEDLFSPLPLDG